MESLEVSRKVVSKTKKYNEKKSKNQKTKLKIKVIDD